MNKKLVFYAVLDGFIGSLILIVLGAFLVSTYAALLSLKHCFLLGFFAAILYTVLFIVPTRKETNNKAILCYLLISIFSFVLCYIIMIACRAISGFTLLPMREVNNADGISILFVSACFILSSFVLKVFALIVPIIKKRYCSQKR